MKYRVPHAIAILLFAGVSMLDAPATAQSNPNREAHRRIGVTIDPTCTVAVVPGEAQPADAIALACRNFRVNQPQPLVLETTPRDGHDVVLIRF